MTVQTTNMMRMSLAEVSSGETYSIQMLIISASISSDSTLSSGEDENGSVSQTSSTLEQTPLLIPAPLMDYRRPVAPANVRTKHPYSNGESSSYAGSTMLMNADDVDLSLESNQHIKPPYNYPQMIAQAILDAENEKLNLGGIYTFFQEKFAYYRNQLERGWKVCNSNYLFA